MTMFIGSLHDAPAGAGHDSEPGDLHSRTGVQMVRGWVDNYKQDEKGRTRWGGETRDGAKYTQVEYLMPAGYMSSPTTGEKTEGWFVSANGDHSQVMFIPLGDSEKRQKEIKEGELGVAHPDRPEQQILYDADGNIRVNAPGKKVHVADAMMVELKPSQDMVIETQNITIKGQSLTVDVPNTSWTGDINQAGSHTDTDPAPD